MRFHLVMFNDVVQAVLGILMTSVQSGKWLTGFFQTQGGRVIVGRFGPYYLGSMTRRNGKLRWGIKLRIIERLDRHWDRNPKEVSMKESEQRVVFTKNNKKYYR